MAQWLDPAAPVLARELRKAGYATGHFGKWHLGGQRDVANAPAIADYGFDRSLTNFEGMGAKLLPLTVTPRNPEPKKIWADAVTSANRSPGRCDRRSRVGLSGRRFPFHRRAEATDQPFS